MSKSPLVEKVASLADSFDLQKLASHIHSLRENDPTIVTITIDDAVARFGTTEAQFLRSLLELTPDDVGIIGRQKIEPESDTALTEITQQYTGADGIVRHPNIKFLPTHVYDAYTLMQTSYIKYLHEKQIQNRPGLIILSGYRSPGYQLLTLAESISHRGLHIALLNTNLPHYSEHGDNQHTAIDFTCIGDENGKKVINDRPVVFELYQEFDWLMENGPDFGFVLTLPPDEEHPETGRTADGFEYEPWHWRYVGDKETAYVHMKNNHVKEKVAARKKAFATHDYHELLDRAIQIA